MRHFYHTSLCIVVALSCSGCFFASSRGRRVAPYRPSVAPHDVVLPRVVISSRALHKRDVIRIELHGIPVPKSQEAVVDESGRVTLPHLGQVKVEGLTPSEAGRMIEREYIDRGYFKQVNVIVTAAGKEYFVRGEVNSKLGRFMLKGEMTLSQAIPAAGGFTDFAKRTKVRLMRGDQVMVFNLDRIDARKDPDPVLKRSDVIVVYKRWLFP